MIPFVDLSRLDLAVKSSIKKEIDKIICKGDYVLGKELGDFEQKFADYIGSKYCIGVASGTDAILLSLIALGVGKNDEVIVPATTFIASANPVVMLGAKPVFVDVKPENALIDAEKIEKVITARTKAIIPVHLYGNPCDMNLIGKIAHKHNIRIIEDACQSHGSEYSNKKTGSLGDISAFSFYPSKNLGAYGDGGAIVTSNKFFADKILSLRNHGGVKKYAHKILGYNSRLDTIQASVLSVKLKELDRWNSLRRKKAEIYKQLLKNLPVFPMAENRNGKTNYHLFVIKTKKRNSLMNHLLKSDIQCGIHYPKPLHLEAPFKDLNYKLGDFPDSERHASECLSLPMFPEISEKEIIFICDRIKNYFTK